MQAHGRTLTDEATFAGLVALWRADLAAIRDRAGRVGPFLYPNFFAVAAFRVAVLLRRRGHAILPRLITVVGTTLAQTELDPEAHVGPGFQIVHPVGSGIGPGVVAGRNLTLYQGALLAAPSTRRGGFPHVGDDVVLYAKSSVIGDVSIGDGAVIGAHALVLHDVGAGTTVVAPEAAAVGLQEPAPEPPPATERQ